MSNARQFCERVLAPFLRVQWARRTTVALIYLGLWCVSFVLALALRFEGAVPADIAQACRGTLVLILALRLATFFSMGLFDGLWRYSGMPELKRLIVATTGGSVLALGAEAMLRRTGTPRSLFIGEWLASVVLVGGVRLLIRLTYERGQFRKLEGTPTLVIGAGDAGEGLLRDLQRLRDGAAWRVVGFLDDDRRKHGRLVHYIPVLGPADETTLRLAVEKHAIKMVVLAMPTAGPVRTRELVHLCRDLGMRTMTVPSLEERMKGGPLEAVREIDIEDLLGRDPVQLDVEQLEGLIEDKVVLITGAGGSIGSELARQALRFKPRSLLLLDHDENAVFFLERELLGQCEEGVVKPLIADICDRRRIAWVFETFRPQVVLHAAAHKHVAMMEANACEAARNNIFGTQILAEAAHAAHAEVFVLISTDKAVNPTSVMGATKRVCEMVVQHVARQSRTRFAAVRFGNVLGSNGSVVPLFREQIARGGPVTVTHPDVTRYFMTIPEAAQLVLQAGALGENGQIMLLDMGEPVKIADLARDLIELSGFRPGVDIKLEYTGLKSGEKIFEEMLLKDEDVGERPHPKIVVGRIQKPAETAFLKGMASIAVAIRMSDELGVRRSLGRMVCEATLTMPVAQEPILHSIRTARWQPELNQDEVGPPPPDFRARRTVE